VSESDMGGKRWVSRGLVNLLIREMRDYKGAAEVVSGAEDVFATNGRDIEAKIAEVEREHSVAAAFELQKTLEEARQEIVGHEAWQREVIESLPKQDDEDGATGPLRQAFARTAKAREALLGQVKNAYDKYFHGAQST
jgi:hypothetical protein